MDEENMTQIPADEMQAIGDVRGLRVLELGNKKNRTGLYRDWYLAQGAAEYVSVDWNGKDGAIAHDMRTELDLGLEPFDVVTNLGFTEHVTEQEGVWRNIHNATKAGGSISCCLPFPYHGYEKTRPNWERHGYWQPTLEWMWALAEANDYYVSFILPYLHRVRPMLISRWSKIDNSSFVWIDKPMHRTSLPFMEKDLKSKMDQ
jgi:hypothetical protein